MSKKTNRLKRVMNEMVDWYCNTIHPELSTRQAWYEFWRYARKHKIGDIHAQEELLFALVELFDWDWVQLIRWDFGEDPLQHNIYWRRENIYKPLVMFGSNTNLREHVHRFIWGTALYNQTATE